jgi:hypothetical protein
MSLFVLTGWALASGKPVFLSKSGTYSLHWQEAQIFGLDEKNLADGQRLADGQSLADIQEMILKKSKIDAQKGLIVDPYLIDVIKINQPIDGVHDENTFQYLPIKQKEQLRLKGPTVRIKHVSL